MSLKFPLNWCFPFSIFAVEAVETPKESLVMNATNTVEADFEYVVNGNEIVDAQTDMQVEQSDKTSAETIEEINVPV